MEKVPRNPAERQRHSTTQKDTASASASNPWKARLDRLSPHQRKVFFDALKTNAGQTDAQRSTTNRTPATHHVAAKCKGKSEQKGKICSVVKKETVVKKATDNETPETKAPTVVRGTAREHGTQLGAQSRGKKLPLAIQNQVEQQASKYVNEDMWKPAYDKAIETLMQQFCIQPGNNKSRAVVLNEQFVRQDELVQALMVREVCRNAIEILKYKQQKLRYRARRRVKRQQTAAI